MYHIINTQEFLRGLIWTISILITATTIILILDSSWPLRFIKGIITVWRFHGQNGKILAKTQRECARKADEIKRVLKEHKEKKTNWLKDERLFGFVIQYLKLFDQVQKIDPQTQISRFHWEMERMYKMFVKRNRQPQS